MEIQGTRSGRPINGWWWFGKENRVYMMHLMGEAWGGWRNSSLQITLFDGVGPLDQAFLPYLRKLAQNGGECCKYVGITFNQM